MEDVNLEKMRGGGELGLQKAGSSLGKELSGAKREKEKS